MDEKLKEDMYQYLAHAHLSEIVPEIIIPAVNQCIEDLEDSLSEFDLTGYEQADCQHTIDKFEIIKTILKKNFEV